MTSDDFPFSPSDTPRALGALRRVLGATGAAPRPVDTDAFVATLRARRATLAIQSMHTPSHVVRRDGRRLRRSNNRSSRMAVLWGGVAALVLAAVGIFAFHSGHSVVMAPERHYATAPGQRASVIFATDAQMILGPATTVAVRDDEQAGLTVTVDGEAVFRVAHADRRPITVQTRGALVRVLGTEFVVQQRRHEAGTHVVVASGRVSIGAVHGHTVAALTSGMAGIVSDSGTIAITSDVPLDQYLGWADGRLVFHGVPARDVVAAVGHAYGVDLTISDSTLGAQPLRWSGMDRQPLTEVLDELAELLGGHVVKQGHTITIAPGHPPSHVPGARHSTLSTESQYGR